MLEFVLRTAKGVQLGELFPDFEPAEKDNHTDGLDTEPCQCLYFHLSEEAFFLSL